VIVLVVSNLMSGGLVDGGGEVQVLCVGVDGSGSR
jgi:hypothetical protein